MTVLVRADPVERGVNPLLRAAEKHDERLELCISTEEHCNRRLEHWIAQLEHWIAQL